MGSAVDPDPLVVPRPGRRAAAVGALGAIGLLTADVAFIVVRHPGLVLVVGLLLVAFFAGLWTGLSRREWWRWMAAVAGVAAGGALLVVVAGLSAVSTGGVIGLFVLAGLFTLLTRYALGDRVEVPM
ncbi:MAG: hypothetical protein U5R31_06280 [Acidimicrobiia bacterium]|nr:hypothetical protein [Acidimicrobiia bacterium]